MLFLLLPWAGENGHLLSSLALVGMEHKGAGLRMPSLLPPALRRLEKLKVEKLPPSHLSKETAHSEAQITSLFI